MKFQTRLVMAFNRLQQRYKVAEERGIYAVCALIRKEARESMRLRKGASKPGTPPTAHVRNGLKEINFHVRGSQGIIGPRKFKGSRFFDRPVPNIHEKGGIAVGSSWRRRYTAFYPERSFMWKAVQTLQRKGRIPSRFAVTVRSIL